jgi:uncharacterized protein (UPF0335 family)
MTTKLDGHRVRSLCEQYERHETKRRDAQDAQKSVLADAESQGINPKLLKRLIQNNRRDGDEVRAEREAYAELEAAYRNYDSTPLGEAAAKAEAARLFGDAPPATTIEVDTETGDVQVEGEGKLADMVRAEVAKGRKAKVASSHLASVS